MKNWKRSRVSPSASILDVMRLIDETAIQIAVVVDEMQLILGTVTDGDIRRAILRGVHLDEAVSGIMNCNPTVVRDYEPRETILALMKQKGLHQIPVVDDEGKLVNIEMLAQLIQSGKQENWVVLMAGGLGERLRPLTHDCPKPLLRVGGKPILETIIQSFVEYGFYRFYIAVNYKAEMIENYFGDGTKWGVEIRYLREERRLGTAGALHLLQEKPSVPLIVMNGDLLTKVNFKQLIEYHGEQRSDATMCVREYTHQIPYGVVNIDKHRLIEIVEKPVQQFFVSAGVYVLEPEILSRIPEGIFFDMPTLFEKLIQERKVVTAFPIVEYWMDIGRINDYERANGEFAEVFE
ncbi:nucleotidyltransferase family protein [Anaeroarcus burkinensis]|uniref:nucleotidyltransferase family protein n=1 Tax=Anaeroarcus burkinensis TaxID=82376 RepID=UPI0004071343|nr:nucleotidyltransferase family protein [Anaeroarcus burkinensis]